jgi:Dolichyl-phosphate-mannose-protein mannosyltransferase
VTVIVTSAKTSGYMAPRFNRLTSTLFIAIAFVFVAARLWHLTSFGVFGDEVFTLWTSEQGWRSLFASVVGDVVHPPLFYVLLKLWIGIGGQSLQWVKLMPALFSIASIVPFFLLCRELNLEPRAMNLALALMAVNGFLINHSQELRMYSLLLLLAVSSLWLFARLLNRDAGTVVIQVELCAVNLFLVFTHYYGWAVVALEFIFLLIWKRVQLRSFAIGAAVLVLCFSPWVYFVAQAARMNPSRVDFAWNQPPALSELIGFYSNLNGSLSYRWKVFGTAIVMLLFLFPVMAWGWRAVGRKREGARSAAGTFCWLALFAFGPPTVSFLASHILPQSVWAFRYLIIAAPPYVLLVAGAAYRLKPTRVRIGTVVLIVCWSALSGFAEIVDGDRIAWQPLVERMIQAELEQPGVRVYVTDGNIGNTVQYYLDQAGETRLQVSFVNGFDSAPDNHFWIALIRYKHEIEPLLQIAMREHGYTVGDSIESEAAGHKAVLFPVWKHR